MLDVIMADARARSHFCIIPELREMLPFAQYEDPVALIVHVRRQIHNGTNNPIHLILVTSVRIMVTIRLLC